MEDNKILKVYKELRELIFEETFRLERIQLAQGLMCQRTSYLSINFQNAQLNT